MQHRDDFTDRIDGHPEPEDVGTAAEPGAQFIELDVRQMQALENAVVEHGSVLPSAGQPGGDCGMAVAKDPYCRRDIHPFCERSQHLRNTLGCGFEAVQWRISARAEGGAAGLAAQGLDAFALAVGAVTNQRVNLRVGDLVVQARGVRAREAMRVDALGRTAAAFDLTPGRHARAHRDGARPRRCRLTADRAGIGRTWFEKSLNLSGESGTSLRVLPTPPDPDQADEQD